MARGELKVWAAAIGVIVIIYGLIVVTYSWGVWP